MDGPEKIILDISSDEEVGWGEGGLTSATDGDAGGRDDGDWLAELLVEFEDKVDDYSAKVVDESSNKVLDDSLNKVVDGSVNNVVDDDSDEVMVIEEILPCKKRKVERPSAKWESSVVDDNDDEDDDDCVVLDGDPDKPVEVNNGGGEHDDSDELLLVSEKGQVACRDYPHPRHLCVKFAFSSSPHETHCDLCHCYVCDSLAPCPHWGTGVSSIDHCHATDKDEYWKSQRKSMKNGGIIAQSVVPNPIDTSLCVGPTDNSQSAYMLNNVLNQGNFGQAVRPPGYSAIVSSTNNFITTPRPMPPSSMATGAPMQRKMLLSKCNARSKYQQHFVSQKWQSVGNANSQPTWRGPETASRLMPNNLHHYNASRNSHPPPTRWPGPRYPVTRSLQMQQRLQSRHQANLGVINEHAGPSLSTHSSMGTGFVTPHASHHRQASPQTQITNLAAPWSQWPSQNYIPSFSGNSMPAPQQIASQPCCSSGFPYMAEVFQNPVPFQHHIPFSDNTGNSLPDQSALPSLSNAAQVSQSPVPYPYNVHSPGNVRSFSSLLENQISNQIQVHDQLHSQSMEGNEIKTGGGGSSSAGIGAGWNSHHHTNETNIAESSQQQLNQTATPAPNGNQLQMLAEAADLGFDDWFLAHDRTLGLDSLDIPLSLVPNNILPPESSSHINDSSRLFDF